PFLSPLPHDSQAWESLLGSPVAGAHRGLTPQMYDMPVVLEKPCFLEYTSKSKVLKNNLGPKFLGPY
ncbi:hypothetical protein ACXM1Q_008775, partial [Streptococcus sp. 10F2]